MRNQLSLLPAMLLLALGVSCTTAKPETETKKHPDYRLVATIKDIMDAQIDPSADFIWNSVSTMETLKTIDDKDADGLFNISNKIDAACESCHKEYWYPNDPGPPKL